MRMTRGALSGDTSSRYYEVTELALREIQAAAEELPVLQAAAAAARICGLDVEEDEVELDAEDDDEADTGLDYVARDDETGDVSQAVSFIEVCLQPSPPPSLSSHRVGLEPPRHRRRLARALRLLLRLLLRVLLLLLRLLLLRLRLRRRLRLRLRCRRRLYIHCGRRPARLLPFVDVRWRLGRPTGAL